MPDDIKVRPAGGGKPVPVRTEVDGVGVHTPIYKTAYGADGDLTLVGPDNPSPTKDASSLSVLQIIAECLDQSVTEQKLTNLYLSKIVGEDLRIDNELENR